MPAATLLQRSIRFFNRGDPISFCARVVPLLIVLPLLTTTETFQRLVQDPLMKGTAIVLYAILRLLGQTVTRSGTYVSSADFSVKVVEGCTGIYTVLILFALTIAFPARWRSRITGILLGAALLGALNVVRLVTLFLIGRNHRHLFDEAHLFVWQTLTVIIALLFWYVWAQRALARLEPAAPETGASR